MDKIILKQLLDNYPDQSDRANDYLVKDIDLESMFEIIENETDQFKKIKYLIIPVIEKLHRVIHGAEFKDLAGQIRLICNENIEKENERCKHLI